MLASIIYNYGKFCDGFKSTLKLGAYEYPLNDFENGKIHVRLQINGVEDTISEIYVKYIETIIPEDDSVRLHSQFVEAMDLTDLYST